MLHFVVCDDNNNVREKVSKVITKLMLPTDIEYETVSFFQYDKRFINFLNSNNGNNIYILDIEVNSHSGLDIARKIREKDWNSIIIILTAHYELAYEAFKNRLMLLDFISKFDNYEKNLYDVLQIALKILNKKEQLVFKAGQTIYKIDFNDILYIIKEEGQRNTIIKTFYQKYSISSSLTEVEEKLNGDFLRTHRACIVNKTNVKRIDFKEKFIVFKNDEKINLLSRNYQKEVKKYVFS